MILKNLVARINLLCPNLYTEKSDDLIALSLMSFLTFFFSYIISHKLDILDFQVNLIKTTKLNRKLFYLNMMRLGSTTMVISINKLKMNQ